MMVTFVGDEAASQAERVADAAKAVRFMEVDVRAAGATATRHRVLEEETIATYDGVVVIGTGGDAEGERGLMSLLQARVTENTVIGAVGGDALRAQASALGGIFIGGGNADAAVVGKRVAKVAGWVRHGLGHEKEAHSHSRGHSH